MELELINPLQMESLRFTRDLYEKAIDSDLSDQVGELNRQAFRLELARLNALIAREKL